MRERVDFTNSRIILVHGFTNNPSDFNLWLRVLKENKLLSSTIPFSKKDTIFESIPKYSLTLSEFIASLDNEKIVLIGYSMGGLVIRFFLQNLLDSKTPISQVVTVATPHYGTNFATLGLIGGIFGDLISQIVRDKPMLDKAIIDTTIAQLSPYSPFIKKLNNITPRIAKIYKKIDFLNIWLKNDSVIIPAGNAIFPMRGIVNREISSDTIHNLVLKPRGTEEILVEEIIPILKRQKRRRKKGPQSIEDWKKNRFKERTRKRKKYKKLS